MRNLAFGIICVGLTACNANIYFPSVADANTRLSINTNSITKLSVSDGIFRTSSNSADCGYYLIALGDGWRPTTFMKDGKTYFSIPCKYADPGWGGWHIALAYWDWDAATGTWLDGNAGSPGIQEIFTKNSPLSDSSLVKDFRTTVFTMTNTGALNGIATTYTSAIGPYHMFPILNPSFGALTGSNVDPTHMDIYWANTNDSTFSGALFTNEAAPYWENGQYYIFNTTRDAPANTDYYISISTSPDLQTITAPTSPIVSGYSQPYITKDDAGNFHMIALNRDTNHWDYITGNSITDWNFADAVQLDLAGFRGSLGTWDNELYTYIGSEPFVIGLSIHGTKLYIFYGAGAYDYTAGTAPYGAYRGIGVLSADLESVAK